MKVVNCIVVCHSTENKMLMCLRQKDPYKGKYNLVGGKKEEKETHLQAAYRELLEETGISKKDIHLRHVMNFQFMLDGLQMEVYYGRLNKEVALVEEKNPLCWVDLTTIGKKSPGSTEIGGEMNC